jgi:hypothetical protein
MPKKCTHCGKENPKVVCFVLALMFSDYVCLDCSHKAAWFFAAAWNATKKGNTYAGNNPSAS